MTATIITFPGCESQPPKTKKVRVRLSKAAKEAIQKDPDPEKDALLLAARASLGKVIESQRSDQERRFHQWQSGKRVPAVRYMALATCGIACEDFGEGTALFRWAVEATPTTKILKEHEKDAALALAIRTLNSLALVARYGMLSGNTKSYRDDDDKGDAEDFEAIAIADLGSALKQLQRFGGRAEQSPSERRRDQARYLKEKARRDAFSRAYDEARNES